MSKPVDTRTIREKIDDLQIKKTMRDQRIEDVYMCIAHGMPWHRIGKHLWDKWRVDYDLKGKSRTVVSRYINIVKKEIGMGSMNLSAFNAGGCLMYLYSEAVKVKDFRLATQIVMNIAKLQLISKGYEFKDNEININIVSGDNTTIDINE